MPDFRYSARTLQGKREKGLIFAMSEADAITQLAQRGLTPIRVALTTNGNIPWWQREIGPRQREISLIELTGFLETLSSLLLAKLPLVEALDFCSSQARKPKLKHKFQAAARDVMGGSSLAQALIAREPLLPKETLNLIETAEAANQLAPTLAAAARHSKRTLKFRTELKSALIYPCILLVMAFVIVLLMMLFLAPTLLPVFEGSGSSVPPVITFLNAGGAFLRLHYMIIIIASCAIAFMFSTRWSKIKIICLRIAHQFWLTRSFVIRLQSHKILQALEASLLGKNTLIHALERARTMSILTCYQNLLNEARREIENGATLTQTLAGSPLIDERARLMIALGEKSDTLEETIALTVSYLAEEIQMSMSRFIKVLTPLLTLIIGAFVAFIMISVLGAIMDLNNVAL